MAPESQNIKELLDENRVINRAMRRKRPPLARRVIVDYIDVLENYTKATHKIKKLRSKKNGK